jgi:hypothetical protein
MNRLTANTLLFISAVFASATLGHPTGTAPGEQVTPPSLHSCKANFLYTILEAAVAYSFIALFFFLHKKALPWIQSCITRRSRSEWLPWSCLSATRRCMPGHPS